MCDERGARLAAGEHHDACEGREDGVLKEWMRRNYAHAVLTGLE